PRPPPSSARRSPRPRHRAGAASARGLGWPRAGRRSARRWRGRSASKVLASMPRESGPSHDREASRSGPIGKAEVESKRSTATSPGSERGKVEFNCHDAAFGDGGEGEKPAVELFAGMRQLRAELEGPD